MASPEALDQIWAKVRRAREHADTAQAVIDSYLADDGITYELHSDHGTAAYDLVLRQHRPPPIDLALAYADELANLRAALDHVVWHLVGAAGHEQTAWPVVMKRGDWKSALGHQIRGFPRWWRDTAALFQPFHYEDSIGASLHPCFILNELNNRNKHRLLVGLDISRVDFRPGLAWNRPYNPATDMVWKSIPIRPGAVVDQMTVTTVHVVSLHDDLRIVDIHPQVETTLSYGPKTDFHRGPLPNLPAYVSSVIEAFAPAFHGHDRPPETH